MATTSTQILSESSIVATTSYATNQSPSIAAKRASMIGLGFKCDTAAGVTGLTFTAQVQMGESDDWYDLYRDNAGTFEVEEYTIPLDESSSDLLRAIRIAGDGSRTMRLNFKGVGGTVTITAIDAVYEQVNVR